MKVLMTLTSFYEKSGLGNVFLRQMRIQTQRCHFRNITSVLTVWVFNADGTFDTTVITLVLLLENERKEILKSSKIMSNRQSNIIFTLLNNQIKQL